MDGGTPADQAYAEDVADLHLAQRMIAQLRRAAKQYTELTYDSDFLPQQRCVLPGVRR